jgi:hypothetical protein
VERERLDMRSERIFWFVYLSVLFIAGSGSVLVVFLPDPIKPIGWVSLGLLEAFVVVEGFLTIRRGKKSSDGPV